MSDSNRRPTAYKAVALPLSQSGITNLAERQGVEPCEPFYLSYGLANRCLTIRPTLQYLVPQVGLEPTRISALASKTSVATITPPGQYY